MQEGYFKTAWNDVKSTPGWFKKMLLMGLVMLIPVFGPIVVYGYLYGWARDIAWGVQGQMPKSLFGNEDGKLYSRGFFALVIGLVCALLPLAIEFIGGLITGIGTFALIPSGGSYYSSSSLGGYLAFTGIIGMLFGLIAMAAFFIAMFFQWVGTMRMSVYGRLSAGLQFGKIWAMIRKDFGGLLRIFGMSLLLGLIVGVIFSIVFSIIFGIVFAIAFATAGGASGYGYSDSAVFGIIMSVIGVVILFTLILTYVMLVASAFIESLVIRALGYWTRQFDVPAWRGQDDPMPFELQAQAAAAAAPGSGQPYAATQQAQPYAAPVVTQAPAPTAAPAAVPVAQQAAPASQTPATAVPMAEQTPFTPAPAPADAAPEVRVPVEAVPVAEVPAEAASGVQAAPQVEPVPTPGESVPAGAPAEPVPAAEAPVAEDDPVIAIVEEIVIETITIDDDSTPNDKGSNPV